MRLHKSWASDRLWRWTCVSINFDAGTPAASSVSFRRYSQNPQIDLSLPADWYAAVHGRGLDQLPMSPNADVFGPYFGDKLMMLQVGEGHFTGGDTLVARATWTRGHKPATGWIAWRRGVAPGSVVAWAVGRTEEQANAGLASWRLVMQPHDDDAVALAGVEL